jgi:hypothetical protein
MLFIWHLLTSSNDNNDKILSETRRCQIKLNAGSFGTNEV